MGNDNYKVYAEIGIEIAEQAGKLLLVNFGSQLHIDYKGRIDMVTEMDMKSEKLIVDAIKKNFPSHDIIAEEGSRVESNAEYVWLIDPLDGTTNYAHGFGFFAVSIALEKRSEGVVMGIVYAPYLNEFYHTVKGGGAYLNNVRITVSSILNLEESLVATGFPYDVRETNDNVEYFKRFLTKTQAVRRPGSAAIDLCSVAAGKFDGFWELKLHPWDTAAGSLMVEEAGGIVSGFNGEKYSPYDKKILATNSFINEEMRSILNE